MVWIEQDRNGSADIHDLEKKLKVLKPLPTLHWFYQTHSILAKRLISALQHYEGTGRKLIGSLSAASNITGVLTDTNAFSALLHSYGALSFWDYATAG